MADCIVVIPCFNEARRINVGALVESAVRDDTDLLFVNDGSTDGTGELLDELVALCPSSFSALHLPQNRGKAEAVRLGIQHAFERRPAYLGYWDADLATPLAAIDEFRDYLAAHPQVEMLLGARVRLLGRTIERRRTRHCAGRLFATAASWVLQLPVYDTQCGAKLLRATDRVRQLFAEPFCSRWIFDVELLARFVQAATEAGECPVDLIHELPLREWRDVAGSKVRPSDFIRAAAELAQIAVRYPLRGRRRSAQTVTSLAPTSQPRAAAANPADKQPSKLERVS